MDIDKTITLLLSCSNKKLDTSVPVRADDLYQGQMFKFGLKYADTFGYRVLILSAKLGWLERGSLIETYDHRFNKPYQGAFPEGEGFYFGGRPYFKNAPARFKPLVVGARGYGDMLGLICAKQREADKVLLDTGIDPDAVRARNRALARGELLP